MSIKDAYLGAQIVTAVWIIGLAIPVKAAYVGVCEVRDRVVRK